MSRRLKNLTWLVVLGLVLGFIGFEFYKIKRSNQLAAERQEQEERATQLERQKRVDQLTSRTNAVTTWRDELPSSGFLFTADLTRVLVRTDGRPLLFDGATAEDVVQHGQEYLCSFRVGLTKGFPGQSTAARLNVSCDPSMAKEIVNRGHGNVYAVVARISDVPSYEDITTNDTSGDSSTERRFTVSGTELGQEHLAPNYVYFLFDELKKKNKAQ
jgi:hypothetical protein